MERISNYLKTVFLEVRQESKQHPAFLFLILTLLSIPLPYAYSSICLILLTVISLFTFKKSNFKLRTALLFPLALFALMAFSLFWTNDTVASIKALQKGLPLLIVPICFLLFPELSHQQKQKIMRCYSIGMVFFAVFYLLKALVRFAVSKDTSMFFYHELVTEDVNAIHVSLYMAIAAFYFLSQSSKTLFDKIAIALLSVILILLSSKNIIVVFALLLVVYLFKRYQSGQKMRILKGMLLLIFLASFAFIGFVKDRFLIELQSNINENTINKEASDATGNVYNVSIRQAWTQEKFKENDYFPGTAFRVYQARIFVEMLCEDAIWLTGYGLNAADFKIKEKGIEHSVFAGSSKFDGYQNKNFHNEYVQIFAELGIFGLLILIAILIINTKNAFISKDFIHISFAILMISLFLTESFLSRQRGIVFFTIMYCLFNSGAAKIAPKIE